MHDVHIFFLVCSYPNFILAYLDDQNKSPSQTGSLHIRVYSLVKKKWMKVLSEDKVQCTQTKQAFPGVFTISGCTHLWQSIDREHKLLEPQSRGGDVHVDLCTGQIRSSQSPSASCGVPSMLGAAIGLAVAFLHVYLQPRRSVDFDPDLTTQSDMGRTTSMYHSWAVDQSKYALLRAVGGEGGMMGGSFAALSKFNSNI